MRVWEGMDIPYLGEKYKDKCNSDTILWIGKIRQIDTIRVGLHKINLIREDGMPDNEIHFYSKGKCIYKIINIDNE